jgi:hypothetical protein
MTSYSLVSGRVGCISLLLSFTKYTSEIPFRGNGRSEMLQRNYRDRGRRSDIRNLIYCLRRGLRRVLSNSGPLTDIMVMRRLIAGGADGRYSLCRGYLLEIPLLAVMEGHYCAPAGMRNPLCLPDHRRRERRGSRQALRGSRLRACAADGLNVCLACY